MKTRNLTLIWLTVSIILSGALSASAQGRQGDGNVTKQERNVGSFTAIDVGGAFDIVLIKGDVEGVVIETDENLQEKILVNTRNGILEFSSQSIRNPTKLKAYVTYVNLDQIVSSGASSIKSTSPVTGEKMFIESSGASEIKLSVELKELTVEISGAGELSVEGTADRLNAEISGAGDLNATKLLCKVGNIESSGAGSAKVNVSENSNFETSGAGSIRNYYGKTDSSEISTSAAGVDVTTHGDSTQVKVGGLEVKVFEGDSTRVTIGNSDVIVYEDGDVYVKKRNKHKFNGHWAGFEMGVNGYLTNDHKTSLPAELDYLQLRYEKSVEVSINFLEQNLNIANNKFGLVTGMGFRSNNYRFEPNVMLLPDTTPLSYTLLEPKSNYLKSKLVVNYVTIPLLLEYQTNPGYRSSSFHFTAGAIMGFRLCSHSKVVEDVNEKVKMKDSDSFHMQPFRWDLTARIGWGIINLYANYSLNSLFLEDKGPELYPFTMGISFIGW